MSSLSRDRIDAFRRSSALQRLATERQNLTDWLKTQPRKIIPVAEVARLLGVSVRQLWKWIDQGWINTYKRPSEHYQKGISKPGFTRFWIVWLTARHMRRGCVHRWASGDHLPRGSN